MFLHIPSSKVGRFTINQYQNDQRPIFPLFVQYISPVEMYCFQPTVLTVARLVQCCVRQSVVVVVSTGCIVAKRCVL